MIEDTRQQLREARLRLKESREALAEGALPLEPGAAAPLDRLENFWGTREPVEEPPAERYVPPSAPDWLQRTLARLPPRARPVAVGAAAMAAFAISRIPVMVPNGLRGTAVLPGAAGMILAAAASGAAGGLAFSLVRPKLEPRGAIGDILTGIVSVTTFLVIFLVVLPLVFGDPVVGVSTSEDVVVLVVCSVLLGSLVGSFFNAARKRDADGL